MCFSATLFQIALHKVRPRYLICLVLTTIMAETANTKQDPSNMESNNKPQEVLTKEHNVRQRVPIKRNKPQKLKGYVSPFLADKAKIDAKFVHLQCVWRDLEKSRKLGKKAFRKRDVDHKPRGKIKHKEDYMDPGVTIKKSVLTSDFKTGVGKLLRLERRIDENDNELLSTKVVEYRNVIHKDSQPVNSLLTIQQKEVKTPSTNNVKRINLKSSPIMEEISTTKTVKPLKMSTRSLRGRSLSTSSEDSLSPSPEHKVFGRDQRTNAELNAGKVTLTQPNSPSKMLTPNCQRSHPKAPHTIRLGKQDNSKENSIRRPNKQSTNLADSLKEGSLAQRQLNRPGSSTAQENYRETKSRNQENKQHSLPPSTNQITSVRIQLDSSFSEDDYQLSPVDFPRERKISVRSINGSPKSATKHDNEKQGREETPVSVLVESESDTDGIKPTHESVAVECSKAKPVPKLYEIRKISSDFNQKGKVFQNSQDVGRKFSQDFKSKRKVFETQEDTSGSKRDLRTKLQNIQSNIHKIVTDIKQSKEATGHVKSSDVSSHEATQSNGVDAEKAPFNVFPRARQPGMFMDNEQQDKLVTVEKDMKTSAHKASASTLVAKGSKRQGMSHIGKETSDTVQVIDRVQTQKENQNSEGKLSDQKETDKLTVMNNKGKRDLSDTCEDKQHHKYENFTDQTKKKHSGHLVDVTVNDNNERNETTHEIVPVKGGGQKRIVRHRSSKGKGQEPEAVATDLQKALLTTKKVIERQLTGIVNERIETDNLVGALKRSMTKPTPREKVASATHEILEIIQKEVIHEENGSRVYQVRVQMGPFTGNINYTQDGHTVIVEGSTVESPIFTKEIKVEFPTQGLDMELLSVHSEGPVVELNVPYLYVPSQSHGAVQHGLDQYIYDEVSALKREYMQPWINNEDPSAAKVAENSLVMSPSSLTKYMTEEDMKQAEELEIKPGEETKDVIVTDLDSPRYHCSKQIPPLPKFAPPAPPQNGLDVEEEEKFLAISKSGKRVRRHRRNTSQSSNASVSSSDATTVHTNNNNNNNGSINRVPCVTKILQEQMRGDQNESKIASKHNVRVHRSRKYRQTDGRSSNRINHKSHDGGLIVSSSPVTNSRETMVEKMERVTSNDTVSSKSRDACNIRDTLKLESNNPDEKYKLHSSQSGNSFNREKLFRRSGQRRSFKKKGSNNSKTAAEAKSQCSPDSLSGDSQFDSYNFSDSTDSEYDQGYKHREKQSLSAPDIQVTEVSFSGSE